MEKLLSLHRPVLTIGIALLILVIPYTAEAARFSGAYLHKICEKDAKGREMVKGGHTACQAYIEGVLDYHGVLQSLKIAPRVDICIPPTVKSGELHDIVLRFLETHTEHDAFIAAPAVTMALFEKYPCY